MKLQSLALGITLGGLTHQAIAAGFIDDSKASLNLRNFYFNSDNRESQGNVDNAAYASQAKEWGQGLQLNVISGFTQGTVGFGLDAIAMTGLKLDCGGRVGKAGIDRTPGALFPTDSDGHAVDEYSKGGVTGKVRISKTEARLGTLQPKLPVINFNDGRLLPQTFEGGQVTSSEIDGLTLTAGQLQSTKTRSSTDDVDLRINGATRPAGTPASTALADSDSFVFAGGDYKSPRT
ncbi:Porin-like protein NicP precursor [compost metagenome]